MLRRPFFIAVLTMLTAAILAGSANKSLAGEPNTISGATWTYLNLVTVINPNWSIVIMPGHRYEFSNDAPGVAGASNNFKKPRETFLFEIFAGPTYNQKINDRLTFKCSLWYYFMGFPNHSISPETKMEDLHSHNFEVIPQVDYKIGSLTLTNRILLHNKFYAKNAYFTTSEQRWGFSTLMRELIGFSYAVTDRVSLLLSNEWFFGAIEDSDTKDMMVGTKHLQGEPFFEVGSFNCNRLYTGFSVKILPELSLTPQYLWETTFDPHNDYELTRHRHYIYITLTYVLKPFTTN